MTYLLIFVLAVSINCGAPPNSNVSPATTDVAGDWTGESICTVKNSPCHDEQVIYHITEPDSAGNLKIQADKVVNGTPEDMGTIDCTYDKKASSIECKMKNWVWHFIVDGDKMQGTLNMPDGTLYRRISVTKRTSH